MFDVDLRVPAREVQHSVADGYIELCGRIEAPGAWLVCGWTRLGWDEQTSGRVRLHFPAASITASATACYFNRDDLHDGAVGFVLLLRHASGCPGPLVEMTVQMPDGPLRLRPSTAPLPMPEATLRAEATRMLGELRAPRARSLLRTWLGWQGYTGEDTLTGPLRLHLESVIPALATGLVLIGWLDDPTECLSALHVRCGERLQTFDSSTWVRLQRRDVQAQIGGMAEDYRLDRGFLAYFPDIREPGAPVCLQIELTDGSLVYRPVPQPTCTGLAAMQQVLGAFHLRHESLARAMDAVIGPAVAALNEGRLRLRPEVQDLCFGQPPETVRCSVIIRLSGHADALEWQLALFSETARPDLELLFVLDDPNLRDTVHLRAETCLLRFGLPFRLLLLDRFVGEAPCLNIATALARGEMLCFLRAEAVADEATWLESLLADLHAAPDIGAIGAPLAAGSDSASPGAGCLAIRRAVLVQAGGFHEHYAIAGCAGEDLCRKLRCAGLRCVQRQDLSLTLLAAAPEPRALWRSNLALYNAWQLQRRWPETAGGPAG